MKQIKTVIIISILTGFSSIANSQEISAPKFSLDDFNQNNNIDQEETGDGRTITYHGREAVFPSAAREIKETSSPFDAAGAFTSASDLVPPSRPFGGIPAAAKDEDDTSAFGDGEEQNTASSGSVCRSTKNGEIVEDTECSKASNNRETPNPDLFDPWPF